MVYVNMPREELAFRKEVHSQVIMLTFFSRSVVWPIQVLSSDFDTLDSKLSATLLTELWAKLYASVLLSSSASGSQRKIVGNKARQNCIQMQLPPLCSWVSSGQFLHLSESLFCLLKSSDSRT